VKIHLKPESLFPGQSAELRACLDGSEWQPEWTWSLPDPDNGRVECGGDKDLALCGRRGFPLVPAQSPGPGGANRRQPPARGRDPHPLRQAALDFLFQACGLPSGPPGRTGGSLLAGDPGKEESAAGKAQEARFQTITKLAWLGDHPDPRVAGIGNGWWWT